MISESATSIKESVNNYLSINSFNFSRLLANYGNHNEGDFINKKGISLEDYASCMNLTGNELYQYPELTIKLRELTDYPILKRTYSINERLTGLAFIEHFYFTVAAACEDFKEELAKVRSFANNLIYLYGQYSKKPIITDFKERKTCNGNVIDTVVINGIEWDFNSYWNHDKKKQTERLDLKALLKIDRDFTIRFEAVKLNTPFIALRLKKHYKQKGHIVWYSLETRAKVSKTDMQKWQSR